MTTREVRWCLEHDKEVLLPEVDGDSPESCRLVNPTGAGCRIVWASITNWDIPEGARMAFHHEPEPRRYLDEVAGLVQRNAPFDLPEVEALYRFEHRPPRLGPEGQAALEWMEGIIRGDTDDDTIAWYSMKGETT